MSPIDDLKLIKKCFNAFGKFGYSASCPNSPPASEEFSISKPKTLFMMLMTDM